MGKCSIPLAGGGRITNTSLVFTDLKGHVRVRHVTFIGMYQKDKLILYEEKMYRKYQTEYKYKQITSSKEVS